MSRLMEYGTYSGQDYFNLTEWLKIVIDCTAIKVFHYEAREILKEIEDLFDFEEDLNENFAWAEGYDLFNADDLYNKIEKYVKKNRFSQYVIDAYPDPQIGFSALEAE